MIATLGLERIGLFDARDLVPVAGAREDGLPGITTPLERMLQPAALHPSAEKGSHYTCSLRKRRKRDYRRTATFAGPQGAYS